MHETRATGFPSSTRRLRHAGTAALLILLVGCGEPASLTVRAVSGPDPELTAPNPSLLPIVNIAPAVRWSEGMTPEPAASLEVQAFARELSHPRWLYTLPNGDVLVAESNAPPQPEARSGIRGWVMGKIMERAGAAVPSADRITLLRDTDGDGEADVRSVFLDGLYSPFGMALIDDDFYVANTDAILRYPYREDITRIDAPGEHVADLPAGPINYHWTKNILPSRDGSRLFATVGSNSNIGEKGMENERNRAAILEVNLETGRVMPYATGLRNPNGLAFEPNTGELWTTVNERDGLGSDLVPDYMTAVVRNGFYGWPYSYFGAHVDERVEPQRPDLVADAIVPDYALGPHTASLGLVFYDGDAMPARYSSGAFVAQHGSWNRQPLSGYKVIFVPFENGMPAGLPRDVLTGFVNDDGDALGRPTGLTIAADGSLLVADDVGNTIWRLAEDRRRVSDAGADGAQRAE